MVKVDLKGIAVAALVDAVTALLAITALRSMRRKHFAGA
jgi:hypothetical protein